MPGETITLNLDASQTLVTMDRVTNKSNQMFDKLTRGAKTVSAVDTAFAKLRNTILGFVGLSVVFNEFNKIDSIKKTADALGLSFERLQKLTLAGTLAGFRNVEDVISRGSEFLEKFRAGDREAVRLGRSLGISYSSTVEDLIARASQAGVSEVTRVSIFGRGVRGRDISQLLQPVEISITADAATAITRFNDSVTILRERLTGDISSLLTPVMNLISTITQSRAGRIGFYTLGGVAIAPMVYRGLRRIFDVVLPAAGEQAQGPVATTITQRLAGLFGGAGAGAIGRFVTYLTEVFRMIGQFASALAAVLRTAAPYMLAVGSMAAIIRNFYNNFRFIQNAVSAATTVIGDVAHFISTHVVAGFQEIGSIFRDLFVYTDGIIHQIVQVIFETFGVDLESRLIESRSARNKAILDRMRAQSINEELEKYSKFLESVSLIKAPEMPPSIDNVTKELDRIIDLIGSESFVGFGQMALTLRNKVADLHLDENTRQRVDTITDELERLERDVGSNIDEYLINVFKNYVSSLAGIEIKDLKTPKEILDEYTKLIGFVEKYKDVLHISAERLNGWYAQIYDAYSKAYDEALQRDPSYQYQKSLEELAEQQQKYMDELTEKYNEGLRKARNIIDAVSPVDRFISSVSDAVQSFVDGFINFDVLEKYATQIWSSIFQPSTTRKPEALTGQAGLMSLLNPVQKLEVPVMSIRNMLQQIISEGLYVRV